MTNNNKLDTIDIKKKVEISFPHDNAIREQKKIKAVELWIQTLGHVTQICDALNISRTTFYSWMKKDQVFAEAIVNAESSITDDVKAALLEKIQQRDLGAIIFWLKNKSSEFADRPQVLQQFNVGGSKDKTDIEFVLDEKGGDQDDKSDSRK
jgi:hypothetical protein